MYIITDAVLHRDDENTFVTSLLKNVYALYNTDRSGFVVYVVLTFSILSRNVTHGLSLFRPYVFASV